MTHAPPAPPARSRRMCTALLLAFPFFVLFSPRLFIGFTHARVDELLVLAWMPVSVLHFFRPHAAAARRSASPHVKALFALVAIFLFGLLYGESAARWTGANLKLVTRPLFVLGNLLVLRFWLLRSQTRVAYILAAVVTAVSLAGAIGCVAMSQPALAEILRRVYSAGVEDASDTLRFDMSVRAMSVFAGYDQAAMAYAAGTVLALHLYFSVSTWRARLLCMGAMVTLVVSIVTSARIGFITALVGAAVLLVMMGGVLRRLGPVLGAALVFAYGVVPLVRVVIPTNATLERFADVIHLFNPSSSAPVWEQSEGVNALLETQVFNVNYPEGLDVVIGHGDNGEFVSDSAFVTVYVKYGLLGVAGLLYAFVAFARGGQLAARRLRTATAAPVNILLPSLAAVFVVGSIKGGLYVITYKVGELFAVLLALSIVESEQAERAKASARSAAPGMRSTAIA